MLGTFSHADIALGCALRFIGEAHPSVRCAPCDRAMRKKSHRLFT